ncbi:putative rab proteins geranylgeranyltransferase component A [Podospora fimiseda]|uniref:Rab proteins geranylgeranyltransferase n=1 Tax=Podospora fimiseda TaxID=252190 RepID=A0AAN7BZ48_9PEZI|nr:putative rab proteins geranylgeranyltransferase component A [Podospora fimiseda]
MESLSDTFWDVVISGTGLQQSLLALALSRSNKKILHIDKNDYYGHHEAALSLQEAESWVAAVQAHAKPGYSHASVTKPEGTTGLSFPRAYSLALAPQFIHARSALLQQLVSSGAYRQVEFVAVGSFFIFKPPQDASQKPTLARIPSTREDVFATTDIPAKAKRGLMKFLKFVLDYENSPQTELWQPDANIPLTEFLSKQFKMDNQLQTYITTLSLSLDGKITTKDGLTVIHRHLTSMGMYGPGFAAIYPKWGGLSEIAQVSCRAGAVGGAVYMLGNGVKTVDDYTSPIELRLHSGDIIKTRAFVEESDSIGVIGRPETTRLVAIIGSDLKALFETTIEGAPVPAVAIVAFPAGSISTADGKASEYPVYLSVHSSDTGECPKGQCVCYLTTLTPQESGPQDHLLTQALDSFLLSVSDDQVPQCLYKLSYTRSGGSDGDGERLFTIHFSLKPVTLSFDDSALENVRKAWKIVMCDEIMRDEAVDKDYMKFTDRQNAAEDDET